MNTSEQENLTGGAGTATPPPVKSSKRVPKWRRVPEPGVPLLRGHMLPRPWVKMIAVWCIHCQKCHTHGWDPNEGRIDHIEHRVAHCGGNDKGYMRTGYYLGLTQFEQERIRQERAEAKKAARRAEVLARQKAREAAYE